MADEGLVKALLNAQSEEDKAPAPESQPESEKKEEPAPSQEEPKVEEKVETPEPKPEEPALNKEVPFHKHPRWIRQQRELAELKAQLEADKAAKPTQVSQSTPVSVPREFEKLFGDDAEAYKQWQTMLESVSERKAREIVEKMAEEAEQEETQAAEFQKKAITWAEDQFVDLSDELGLDLSVKTNTIRNQILDIIAEYELYDANGLPKIKEANKLRTALYPATSNVEEKKKVLAKTAAKSNAPAAKDEVWTPKKLREAEKRGGFASFLNL